MKLPGEPEFEVAYRLVPKRDEPQGNMAIKGLLTYSVGNENKQLVIKEMDVSLEELSLSEKRNLLATGAVPAGAKTATETVQKPEPEPVQKTAKPAPQTTTRQQPAGPSGRTISNTPVLAAGTGVYFRVQLSANQKAFDARTRYRKAGVDQEVYVEEHNGLYKYTAGSFTTYNQASAYKKKLEKLPGVSGAFVVGYQDGKRVQVSSIR